MGRWWRDRDCGLRSAPPSRIPWSSSSSSCCTRVFEPRVGLVFFGLSVLLQLFRFDLLRGHQDVVHPGFLVPTHEVVVEFLADFGASL